MEGPAHWAFSVEGIPTKSVAFHPTLATITHEFPVRVQPGAFAITINKIDQQVDPESIRVESLGPAKVIDIQHANVLRYSSTCKPSSDIKPGNDSVNRERQPMGYGGAGAQDPHRGEYGPALYEGAKPSMLQEQNQRPAPEKPTIRPLLPGQVTAPAPASSPGTLPGDEENQAGGKTQSNESELKLHDLNIKTLFPTAKDGLEASMYHDFYPPDSKVPESISQGHGLSVSYELPGWHIAELDLQASFTHVIVPKRHAAAFLRAKVQNTSPVNIRSGEVNLIVDGTCFGNTNVPSCVRNEIFELNLGVDRFIKVAYKEPGITQASCKIKNTRDHAVNVLVLDQVPVSVDDHFDVEILTPETLGFPGDKVDLTEPGKPGTKTAELGRDGESTYQGGWTV
ncbi:hypothetical protein BO83DRAFT_399775 [Aspergillus eucalypticola CBS 122712]|uniref:DUF4140 domain-containing protein n=1 Tax=Aspergillus eucalypticola (strain CBS 122712 / IBT 29274) TaxID=1448314 RepID=A0A317VCF8_ASPEC|nr:uncharacterized protein BO83DRAFT_399775 [Aspergillus eucalypticola CBS 122712]PWY70632.1 hypothetical protein BO83DRAFT_399775 [Aspergillus eucalypticola CBS 122712]